MAKQLANDCKHRQKGASLVLFTFLMVFLIVPMLGLAIDGSIVMWEKARLATSVDAAALAAGRSLSVGQDLSSQTASAIQTAQNYFNANFQPGQMGTTVVNGQPTISVAQPVTATRTVTIQANITVPLYFLRLLGFSAATLQATGQASRRDVNVLMVLDRSGSMATSNSCAPMIASAQNFANMFVDGRDQLGLITFQTTANAHDYDSTIYFKSHSPSLNSVLGQIVCAGGTNSAEALSLAQQQIRSSGWKGAINIVVFYSDGYPTSMTFGGSNGLPIITQAAIDAGQTDQRYDPVHTSTLNSTAPSSCSSSASLTGVVSALGTQNPDATGYSGGVLDPSAISISSNANGSLKTISAPGCSFANTSSYGSWAPLYIRNDIAYIPASDRYGNSTQSTSSLIGPNPFKPVDFFYFGGVRRVRPDTPKGIINSAFITADNAAYSIRYDPDYSTVIYSIGLGTDVDDNFMERLANDPRASNYDSNKPAGLYVKAPTSTQLQTAFQQIASQILRISQ